jgi:hypothetical protein
LSGSFPGWGSIILFAFGRDSGVEVSRERLDEAAGARGRSRGGCGLSDSVRQHSFYQRSMP